MASPGSSTGGRSPGHPVPYAFLGGVLVALAMLLLLRAVGSVGALDVALAGVLGAVVGLVSAVVGQRRQKEAQDAGPLGFSDALRSPGPTRASGEARTSSPSIGSSRGTFASGPSRTSHLPDHDARPVLASLPEEPSVSSPAAKTSPSWSSSGREPSRTGGGGRPDPAGARRLRTPTRLTWSLKEPISLLESYREDEVWALVERTRVEPAQLLAFTHGRVEELETTPRLAGGRFVKISRLEGEAVVPPGDVDRIGDLIEKHLELGPGRIVVLPGLETLVESSNARYVRKLVDLVRDLAMDHKGAALFSVDPASLPASDVAVLTRGINLLNAQAPVPTPG